MNDIEKELLEYWEQTENIFPDIFTMSKTFGIKPEDVCDILFKDYQKFKHYHVTEYADNKWFKSFGNPYKYSLLKDENNHLTFLITDGNNDNKIYSIKEYEQVEDPREIEVADDRGARDHRRLRDLMNRVQIDEERHRWGSY